MVNALLLYWSIELHLQLFKTFLGFLGRQSGKVRSRIAKRTDERIKVMSEVINGIQVRTTLLRTPSCQAKIMKLVFTLSSVFSFVVPLVW